MNSHMELLSMALPEDLEKAKWCGDFKRAERIIAYRLNNSCTSQCMKDRLIIEQEVLKRLPEAYPYTEAEALALVQREIPDMTMAELQQWEDSDIADWIYIDGIVHLQDRFFDSIKKVYPEIARRAGAEMDDKSLLNDNVKHMKENGDRKSTV